MRSGVSFPQYLPSFALSAGTPDSDFPVANLADLSAIRAVLKASGALVIDFTLPSAVDVGLVALVQHNAAAGATWRVELKAGATTVADSGVVSLPSSAIFPQTTPYAPAAAVSCDNGTITLSAAAWVIGGVSVSGFWSFHDVAVPREIGVSGKDSLQELLGADHATKLFASRTLSASREAVDIASEQGAALDFVKQARGQPFIWAWDVDDPTTWTHQCWLARAPDPALFAKLGHPQGRVGFKFVEHLG